MLNIIQGLICHFECIVHDRHQWYLSRKLEVLAESEQKVY